VGLVHAAGNLAALSLQAASYLSRRRGRPGAGAALSAAGLAIMAGAGYLGGHLSYTRGMGVDHTALQEDVHGWTRVALLSELAPDTLVRVLAGGVRFCWYAGASRCAPCPPPACMPAAAR
jgi:hypothetical protein